jgi:hypothetical protein
MLFFCIETPRPIISNKAGLIHTAILLGCSCGGVDYDELRTWVRSSVSSNDA